MFKNDVSESPTFIGLMVQLDSGVLHRTKFGERGQNVFIRRFQREAYNKDLLVLDILLEHQALLVIVGWFAKNCSAKYFKSLAYDFFSKSSVLELYKTETFGNLCLRVFLNSHVCNRAELLKKYLKLFFRDPRGYSAQKDRAALTNIATTFVWALNGF